MITIITIILIVIVNITIIIIVFITFQVTNELEDLYKRSTLAQSFERVEVEAFSPGSIIVDYYVVFNELATAINTQDLKDIVEVETKMPDDSGKNMLGDLQIDPNRYHRPYYY